MKMHGFTLIREERLKEVGGTVHLWEHDKTGSELLSIINQDENKAFGVNFRTPPKNSTGVAHILEHSVLCGSKKYPVKEPFVELLKSSLQTFLNALTFPDKTCYPVASTNLQDFYNLIDVYIDAVFFPRIDENVLRQEGWHIEQDEQGEWIYKGVVFNEMKGVYSSPDSVLMEQSQQNLFPDTLYNLDSGGNPEAIINLSYAEFLEFHQQYYHPSNARFFFWGDDPEPERLKKINDLLAQFDRREVHSAIPLQTPRDLHKKVMASFPAGESDTAQGHVTMNWLLCRSDEVEELLMLEMLEHVLIGLPGSPLRKALLESGLGEDITGAGLETDLRQAYFSVGLRSVAPDDADKLITLIVETLANLVKQGISGKEIEAAVNSLEFELRENNTGRFPRGLAAMFRSLTTWLYGQDPIAPLAWEKPLNALKDRLGKGEKVFEQAIAKWLLDNRHQVTVVLAPDTELSAQRQCAENKRLQADLASMDDAGKIKLLQIAEELRLLQEKPDNPEALDTIPSLGLHDLPLKNQSLPCLEKVSAKPKILLHDINTTGIVYSRLLFPIQGVPNNLLPLISLYARALTELGTKKRDYVDLGLEVAAKTGDLEAFFALHTRIDNAAPLAYLEVAGKSLADKSNNLVDLLSEIIFEAEFNNRDRFMQMVLEEKARLEQSIIPAGHAMVSVRLSGQLSSAGWLAELTNGVSYLNFIRDLANLVQKDWAKVLTGLQAMHQAIMRKDDAIISLTADQTGLATALPMFEKLADSLPGLGVEEYNRGAASYAGAEALLVPAQVNYVGLGLNLGQSGYKYHGSANVIMRHLRMGYLWDRVRVQGGAYGIFANFSRPTGILLFLSYRDPNVARTLDVYAQTADYLGNLRLSKEDITRAVVGAIGDLDAYLLPGAKGSTALWRHLAGDTDTLRQQIREEILGTTLKDFHDFAPFLAKAHPQAVPCALGGTAVEKTGHERGWKISKIL